MHMRLHKSGQQRATMRRDDRIRVRGERLRHLRDAVIFDQHVTREDAIVCIHRDDSRAFNQKRFGHSHSR